MTQNAASKHEELLVALKRHSMLRKYTPAERKKFETQLDAAEKAASIRLPEVLREVLVRYGGVSFDSFDVDFEVILPAIESKHLEESYEWGSQFVQIAREGDGSPYLLERTNELKPEAPVYRFGHDEGDDEPQVYTPTISEWLTELSSETDPYEEDE